VKERFDQFLHLSPARSGWIVLLFLLAVLPAASQATLTKPTASEPTPEPAIPTILAVFDRYEVVAMPLEKMCLSPKPAKRGEIPRSRRGAWNERSR